MEKLGDFIKGRCMEMCPKEEMKIREHERLLHRLEMLPGTENDRKPKADPNRIVKCFSRSAAGKSLNNANNLRPPEILSKTISYLLFEVVDAPLPWHLKYEFISDRLRAVRQDMIIQNLSLDNGISLLQPMVRFYAYAAYKLCIEDIRNFDPVLNRNQLQECLKKLLSFYDSYDQLLLSTNSNNASIRKHNENIVMDRPEFEALYLILNIGSEEALLRALQLPNAYNDTMIKQAFKLSLAYLYNDFVRMCKMLPKLATLLAATASLHLPEIRRKAFLVMCHAYHSQNLPFALDDLQNILVYSTQEQIINDLQSYGISMDKNNVYFNKKCAIIDKKTVAPSHEQIVEEKLTKQTLQSLLLC